MTVVIQKPWGHEILIAHNDRYALKDIVLKAGTRSSLQLHERKLETILVISGRLRLERGLTADSMEQREYGPGESYTIEPGVWHRVTALEDVRVIEASTPELDDVIRLADDYGRSGG